MATDRLYFTDMVKQLHHVGIKVDDETKAKLEYLTKISKRKTSEVIRLLIYDADPALFRYRKQFVANRNGKVNPSEPTPIPTEQTA